MSQRPRVPSLLRSSVCVRALFAIAIAAWAIAIGGCGRSDLEASLLGGDGGAPGGCYANSDCTATPATPICDLSSGVCVQCEPPADNCPTGAVCDAATHTCAVLCDANGACPGGTVCCGALCVNESTDPTNCGACGRTCASGSTCSLGACTAPVGCKQAGCAAGLTCCGDTCVDTSRDLQNCGGCFSTCPASSTSCQGGGCCQGTPGGPVACSGRVCPSNLVNCANICVDENSDPNNCGICGHACAPGQACSGGLCTSTTGCRQTGCALGFTCCGDRCIDTQNGGDLKNCGGCFAVCPANATSCQGGACCGGNAMSGWCSGFACPSPRANCANVCVDESNDPKNCGGCGWTCPLGSTCMGGSCTPPGCNGGPTCGPGQSCCGLGCTDTSMDPNNCGGCKMVCPRVGANAVPTCKASSCGYACTSPFLDCNGLAADGCEINSSSDPNHCGGCGVACPAGTTCLRGTCAGVTEGPFDPVVNPTYLTPGLHLFTTIHVPAGVVVYVAGAGPASGTLDLRATGDITIDGTIDVSGGPGSQSTVTSQNTTEGRAGSGGYSGELRTAAPSAACAGVVGNGGLNGTGPQGSAGTCVAGPTACGGAIPTPFAALQAAFGGGAGVFTGFRAYGSGGGGPAGGAPGALGAPYPNEADCSGAAGGGGATNGAGGKAMAVAYDGADGTLGQTQCLGTTAGVPPAYVGGGGGGSIGFAAANDLPVAATFQVGSGGGGGSADYLDRPFAGGTSGGGGGGGALRLSTPTAIVVGGQLRANGGDGADAFIGNGVAANCDPQPGAAGGGGSGGVIYMRAPSIAVGGSAIISAVGGAGGAASLLATGGGGGDGGPGRIRLSVDPAICTLSGTFNPPLASSCTPTNPPVAGSVYVGVYPN